MTLPSQPRGGRLGIVERDTKETQIRVSLDVDGQGQGLIQTGSGSSTTCWNSWPATACSTWR